MNRITSPIACLSPETAVPPSDLRPEGPSVCAMGAALVQAYNPFETVDFEGTVLYQVQRAFGYFSRILDICCVDCPIENGPENNNLSSLAAESAVAARSLV